MPNTIERNMLDTLKQLDGYAKESVNIHHTVVTMAVKAICLALVNVANAIREGHES